MSRQDSKQIEEIKVMLLKGDNGSSIATIEKTGTSGLVDTYTVTLTDGSKTTFNVTNGSSIDTIEKTSTDGLVDTYTITLTDGSTSTFTVTNGTNGSNANLADVAPSSVAQSNYNVGEHLIYNDGYYVVIQPISVGDTIEVGTNIQSSKVGTEIVDLKTQVAKTNKTISCSLIFDGNFLMSYALNGATYIGDGKIVAYFAKNNLDSDIGKLRCFNLNNYTMEWEYDIEGYHGNSLAYRSIDNCIYICGCFMASDSATTIDNIIVVDLDHPDSIKSVIHSPIAIGSMCYDMDNDTFYGSGDTPNTIYEFNGIFESVKRTITVDFDRFDLHEIFFDRMSCVKDGIIYGFAYTLPNNTNVYNGVFGYRIADGEYIYSARISPIIHGFRSIGEIQNIIYNFDDDEFIIGSKNSYSGVAGYDIVSFFIAGLYQNVVEKEPYADNYDSRSVDSARIIISVANGTNELRPFMDFKPNFVKCFSDAVNISNSYHRQIVIYISTAYNGVLEIGNIKVKDFNARIQPSNNSNVIVFNNFIDDGNNNIIFINCNFTKATKLDSISEAIISVSQTSKLMFVNCTFADYTNNSSLTYHFSLVIDEGATVNIDDNTNLGSKSLLVQSNGQLLTAKSSKWNNISGTVNSVANTYVESSITSFTVPSGRTYECKVWQGYSSAKPLGVVVTSSTATSVGNPEYVEESPTSAISKKNTGIFILSAGTYKIWCKKDATANNESVTISYKDITY